MVPDTKKKVKKEGFVLNFLNGDTLNTVSRSTVKKLQEVLGLPTETAVVHYALARLAENFCNYEEDPGVTKKTKIKTVAIPSDAELKSSL